MSDPWDWERDHGFDTEGYQRKQACLAIAACPVCGKEVELAADTESWTEGEDGRWAHDGYGPAMGVCCDRLLADWWEGTFAFDLSHAVSDDDYDPEDYE
jgi:hypothetical protein